MKPSCKYLVVKAKEKKNILPLMENEFLIWRSTSSLWTDSPSEHDAWGCIHELSTPFHSWADNSIPFPFPWRRCWTRTISWSKPFKINKASRAGASRPTACSTSRCFTGTSCTWPRSPTPETPIWAVCCQLQVHLGRISKSIGGRVCLSVSLSIHLQFFLADFNLLLLLPIFCLFLLCPLFDVNVISSSVSA